jgi:pimeloyl-ACP methyl ester carboxylesterase
MGFVNVGDVDLYYEEKGDGAPILLIPPSGATASTWGELVDDLADVGRVIAYDRRGYTRSGGGIVRDASTHTRDAAALLAALAHAPAVVVGTSAGATIALDLAARRPELVRGVVAHEAPWRALLHPALPGLAALARMQWLAWQGQYADATEVLLRYVYSYRDGASAWDAFPDEWRQVARRNGRAVIADLHATLGSYPAARALARMVPPVVCTYGARSGNYMQATTRALAGAVPTAALRQLEGTAHAVPLDAPEEFARVIADVISASGERLDGQLHSGGADLNALAEA